MAKGATKYDLLVDQELSNLLESGEEALGRAFVWTGPGMFLQILLLGGVLAFLFSKYYIAIVTDRRLILMETKSGMTGLKSINVATESIGPKQLSDASMRGAGNQRRLVLELTDGSTRTLRLNTLARTVSGQKEFVSIAETRLRSMAPAT